MSYRRIGSVIWDGSASTLLSFRQCGVGNERIYYFTVGSVLHNTRLLSAGAANSPTDLVASLVAPPSANRLLLRMQNSFAGANLSVWPRNSGNVDSLGTNAIAAFFVNANSEIGAFMGCDGAQGIQYFNSAAGGASYIDCGGYQESLA